MGAVDTKTKCKFLLAHSQTRPWLVTLQTCTEVNSLCFLGGSILPVPHVWDQRKPRHQFCATPSGQKYDNLLKCTQWTQVQSVSFYVTAYYVHDPLSDTGYSDTIFFCVSLTFINDCSESYETHGRVLSACIWNSCSIFAYISSLETTTEGYMTWQDHNQETPQIFYTHIYRFCR